MSDLFETQEAAKDSGTPAPKPEGQGNGSGNQSGDVFADQLAQIKAEDGRQKYADVPTALQSIPHAQNRIQELQQKVKELEEENARRAGFDDVLSRLDGSKQSAGQPAQQAMSAEELHSLVENALENREKQTAAKQNQTAVSEALIKKFGDTEKATEQLKAKAAQLGIGMDMMGQLAQTSPNAVLSYFNASSVDTASPSGYGEAPVNSAPAQDDPFAAARGKLFGQTDALLNKWRSASSNN